MIKTTRKILLLFPLIFLLGLISLWADSDKDDDDRYSGRSGYSEGNEGWEDISNALGNIALIGLIGFNAIYYYTMGYRKLPQKIKSESPDIVRLPIRLKRHFRNFHYLGNPIIIIIAWLHGYWAEEGNALVWMGWGILVLLSLTGLIMKMQRADDPGSKLNRLIHTQHLLSLVMIFMLLVGHGFLD